MNRELGLFIVFLVLLFIIVLLLVFIVVLIVLVLIIVVILVLVLVLPFVYRTPVAFFLRFRDFKLMRKLRELRSNARQVFFFDRTAAKRFFFFTVAYHVHFELDHIHILDQVRLEYLFPWFQLPFFVWYFGLFFFAGIMSLLFCR